MAGNDYHFVTHWRVRGTCEEVADLLGRSEELPRWWPSVYLRATIVRPATGAHGLGEIVDLYTKGYLPYRLRWQFEVVDVRYPHGSTIQAKGDFVGTGVWTFEQDGEFVNVTYDWRIRAEKALLRTFTPILRPLFESNHRWAMAQGEASIRRELERLRLDTSASFHASP